MRSARLPIPWGAALFLLMAPLALADPSAAGGISLEREIEITLDRPDYQPKPMDDRTPLILRLEKVTPTADGRFSYSFHYLSFEPGAHRLADYLIHPDGTPATEIGELPIQVNSVLPPDFQGELNPFEAKPFPWVGGYRATLVGLAVLWLGGLPALLWLGRKKSVVTGPAVAAPSPSYAERMRPLVEAAAAGQLNATGQAALERLITGYWREKLAAPGQRMSETQAALKSHPAAGELLRALERWLHHPGGATRAEINTLLEPYRNSVVADAREVGV
jgi:hypothetical protein